jgi:thioredoxin reductase (NADPH)
MTVRALALTDFESTIRDNPVVLVDFWARWCGPAQGFGTNF